MLCSMHAEMGDISKPSPKPKQNKSTPEPTDTRNPNPPIPQNIRNFKPETRQQQKLKLRPPNTTIKPT